MKQQDIGIDLGTTSIIIATEQQGVVFTQPTIGAVDTRSNTILAVGDEALRMVGRAPAHIDLVRPLRDGVIQDHRMTNELIVRFVNEVCRSRFSNRGLRSASRRLSPVWKRMLSWNRLWRPVRGRSILWMSRLLQHWGPGCRFASPMAVWLWTSAEGPPTLQSSAWAAE